jgi:hypothetical protein
MSESNEKLRRDLDILEAMASEMDEYLRSQTLFWPMMKGNLPRLTIGGYLTRQHRLLALRDLLDASEQDRLDTAIGQFEDSLVEKVVRLEERANEELRARLRQWGEYLKELHDRSLGMGDFYSSHVQTRAMLSSLVMKLQEQPYVLDQQVLEQLDVYDNVLRNFWKPGAFIWPDGWQPAYPTPEYWWLYGRPRSAV